MRVQLCVTVAWRDVVFLCWLHLHVCISVVPCLPVVRIQHSHSHSHSHIDIDIDIDIDIHTASIRHVHTNMHTHMS